MSDYCESANITKKKLLKLFEQFFLLLINRDCCLLRSPLPDGGYGCSRSNTAKEVHIDATHVCSPIV